MDGTAFTCCMQNKRKSGLSVWTANEGCTCTDNSQNMNPLNPECTSCSRNFVKCKPWRRKSLLTTTLGWTWLSTFSCLNLIQLLASLSHSVLHFLSRTMSNKKTSRFRFNWLLFMASFVGGFFLPLTSGQESLQPTPSVNSQLPNAVVYVGSAFSYKISTSVFDCEVDNIVVSETADRFLSHWLSYNSEKKQLYGVPSDKDAGTYNILVVALTKDGAVRGHVCGSKSFSIIVMPVSKELPVSVHFGTGASRSYHNSVHSLSCVPGTQAILGTIILNANIQGLNGHERMVLLLKMADHLNVHASKVSFFSGETSHPLTQHLDNPAVMAAGVGDGRFAKGSRSLLTWNIGCGAFKLEDAAFARLETDAQDGTISSLLGFPVVGWHVMSGAQKNMARHRVRRAAGGIGNTPTPTTTSAPPTRLSNMSTIVITSRTVTLSVNSTVRLSTSGMSSSAAPNRTVVESSDVSINSTVFSLPTTRTIQSSTRSVNLTVSSPSPNRTVVQSSSVSINLTASSQLFSRTVVQSSSFANLSSQSTTFSLTSTFSSPILTQTLNSSTTVMPRSVTQIFNRTLSLTTTPSLNSTFITRTATTGISSSVPTIFSSSLATTRSMNSSGIELSPNKSATVIMNSTSIPPISTSQMTTPLSNATSLVPATPQVNSSVIIATSSFTVSSNRTTLVSSTSIFSSTSQVLTTTSSTIISSSQLNSSVLNVTLPMSTSQPTSTVNLSSSSMSIVNTSIPVTIAVNQTSLPTRSRVSDSSSILLPTSTFSITSSSSLVTTFLNATSVENVTSSIVTRSFVSSLLTVSSPTPQLPSTTMLNRTSLLPTSTSFVSSLVPTMGSTIRSFTVTSFSVPSTLNSSVIPSSSLILPSSSLERPFSFSRVNITSVVGSVTSATIQPNVTSTTAVVSTSLTPSPLITSVNLTSVVITVNASTTERTVLLNSTSFSEMSTIVTLTTSSRTSGLSQTLPSTFATDQTIVTTTSRGVDISSVNITSTPKISTTSTLILSSDSALSTFQLSSIAPSSVLSPSFTKLPNSSFVTASASSEVQVNSTTVSRTQESSSTPSSAVTRLVNSSVTQEAILSSSPPAVSSTALVVNSTIVPSSSRRFTDTSSLVPPSSKTVFVSSTIAVPNTTSLEGVSKTSMTFSSPVTLIQSSVLNSSSLAFTESSSTLRSSTLLTTTILTANTTVISTTEVNFFTTMPLLNSSLVVSTVKQTTAFSTSGIGVSSEILQNSTTVLRTNKTVSPSSSARVSSSSLMLRNSTFSTALPTSATVLPTSGTVIPTSTTVIPTSSPTRVTTMSSFSRPEPPSSNSTPVLTESTLKTKFSIPVNSTESTHTVTHSTRVSLSNRIPSSIQPSVTVTPTSRFPVSRTTSILDTSGTLPSSSVLSSNTTQTVTSMNITQTVIVLPSSSVPPTPPPNFPPILLNNIGRVLAPAGKALHYTIPDDTFYDFEDQATTRNLTLSIKLANGSSIPTDFWLQFDTTSQTINGLPLNEHVPDGIVGEVFVLHARDRNSLEARDAFEVFVVPSEKPVVQELRVKISNEFPEFSRNLSQRLALLKKIATYYGDADESNIRVSSFTSGSVIMTWTNDSLPTDRCDEEKLQYVANKMLLPSGEVKEEFKVALEGFPVQTASEERLGVCNGSYIAPSEEPIDPARQQSKMEESLWYKHVLVGLLIVFIIIILAVLLIWCLRRRRPKPSNEKRTFKKRKPIVLDPEIELKPIPGKPLVLPEDDPSFPPSYISETSLDKPMYSDDEDEEDYGKTNPGVVYEPPPPFHQAMDDDDPRNSPPPAYLMPPMY